jgi:dynein heavy chain
MNMTKKMDSISLGRGQDKKAEKLIEDSASRGGWALLMNCHLATSFMPKLEVIVENLDDSNHRDFRLWLTSMPCKEFPVSTLQNSVKMTLEPPKGLRSNLLRTYENLDNKELNECEKPDKFKTLLFGFSFFHAIVQDRRKFGPIGWNIPYAFTNEDLFVCRKQLKTFIDEYDFIPYKVLNYLGAEINYGGRVTDDKDSRLIINILMTYIRPEVFDIENFAFSESGIYISPPIGDQEDYIEYIKSFPLNPEPEVFGLHNNAEITTDQNEARNTLETILSMQSGGSSGGGKTREELIGEIAKYVESRTPAPFDIEDVGNRYPTQYSESSNTVLLQECIKYNRLISVMQVTLKNV